MKKRLLAAIMTAILICSSSFCSMAASVDDPIVPGDPFTLKDIQPENIEFGLRGMQDLEDDLSSMELYKIVTPAGNQLVLYLAPTTKSGSSHIFCAQLTPQNMVMAPDLKSKIAYYNYKTNFFNVTDAVDFRTGEKMTFRLDKYTDDSGQCELFSRKIPDRLYLYFIDAEELQYSIGSINWIIGEELGFDPQLGIPKSVLTD